MRQLVAQGRIWKGKQQDKIHSSFVADQAGIDLKKEERVSEVRKGENNAGDDYERKAHASNQRQCASGLTCKIYGTARDQ